MAMDRDVAMFDPIVPTPRIRYMTDDIDYHRQTNAPTQGGEHYRAIVDLASDGVITMRASVDGRIRTFNRAAERIFGYTAAEVIGRPFTLLLPERIRAAHRAGLERYQTSRGFSSLGGARELTGLRKDGAEIPLAVTVAVVDDGDDAEPVFVSIVRDITARKRAKNARARQASLLDLAHDAIMVRSFETGEIVYWSRGAETLYGWSSNEAVGRVSHTLLRTSFPGPREEIDEQVRRTGAWEGELGHSCRDRTRVIVDSRWAVERDEAGAPTAILEINRDITARKCAEMERTAALGAERAYSRRLGELATLRDDFMAVVAHELASPIAAIQAWSGMLGVEDATVSRRVDGAAMIRDQADALAALVADVQAIATVERDGFAVHPLPTPLAALVDDAVAFAGALPGRHPVTVAMTADVAQERVLADADRIGQVLRNLLGNAAKHTMEGTPIELRATRLDERVRIEVADCGAGIRPDDLADIFEKFRRGRVTHRRVAGQGLGLYLSRQIVRAHGADLTARSAPGAGTTMGFELEVAL